MTTKSAPTTTAEIPLTRAAKEELLRQMYSRAHWIELIRLIGYQSVPMEKARQAIKPLAEQYGKESVASACEVLVEIVTPDKEPIARLKPHVRRMAFQILGPEPSPNAVASARLPPMTTPNQPPEPKERPQLEPKKAKRPVKSPTASTGNTGPPATGSPDSLMQQYRAAKEKHPDMLLVFRMGDFYELFDQDAETAHKLLGLTLTTRDRTLAMAGFPHHQLEVYLHKLLKEGQRVAICEPVEDSLARGPIRREVTRVVTPVTMVDEDSDASKNGQDEESVPDAEGKAIRQPRHYVLKQFEAWLNGQGLAFVAVADVRRTTPAVAPYVGVLDFIVMRGDEKILVTVRPHLLAKHVQAIRELQDLFGVEYRAIRFWPIEGTEGWTWPDYPIDLSATNSGARLKSKPRRSRSRASKPQ